MNVGSLLTANAWRLPSKCALIEKEKRISYRVLNERVNKLANQLIALGAKKGDKASLYLANSVEFVEIFFACCKLGIVVVPINVRIKGRELIHIVVHSDSSLLFFDEVTRETVSSLRDELKGARTYVFVGEKEADWYRLYQDLFCADAGEPPVEVFEEDEQAICYTAGTTGLPKGVLLTNINLISCNYYVMSAEYGVTHDDVFLAPTPLSQRIGFGKMLNAVALGCTLVLIRSFDAHEVMTLVAREKVTILSIIPTIGRLILQLPNLSSYDTASLKMFFVTGEAFPVGLRARLTEAFPHVRIVSYYACTEAALVTSNLSDDILAKPASVGHLLPGVEVKILNDQGEEVAIGETGEIAVRCWRPGMFLVMKGYYKNAAQTKEVFVGDWLRTGDIGKFDEQRYLYIVDRKRDMIISGGFNIYSREVEAILESNQKVSEAAVIGVPHEKYGEAVKAFIVLKSGEQATEQEMIEYCKAHMASYKKPKYVTFIDSLPRNTVGKVMKYKLRG